MSDFPAGVSFVVPVHNGARSLARALDAIIAQDDGRPMEILAVNDASTDDSGAILARYAGRGVTVLEGEGRGAAAAINLAVGRARHAVVCQVDQDVIIEPGWMSRLVAVLDSPDVGAAQGYYTVSPSSSIWARVMGLDLQDRYRRIRRSDPDHVCTGNSAYRAEALRRVGPFDEALAYGYDNDMSYRLTSAGYRLVFRRDAVSVHCWRERAREYLVQQYGVGYGRLDVVAKHPQHLAGDDVSGPGMILHAAGTFAAAVCLAIAGLAVLCGGSASSLVVAAALLLLALIGERVVAGIRAAVQFKDPAALLFAPVHVLRDCAWAMAIAAWTFHRMSGRSALRLPIGAEVALPPARARFLALILAGDEPESLAAIAADLRRRFPRCDVLVVDNGSRAETRNVVERLGVRWLRLPVNVGVGAAVRAGLRYGRHCGHDTVVRIDGDGRHQADQIEPLLGPILAGRAAATVGSRYRERGRGRTRILRRMARGSLALMLSCITRQRVTDPTSKLWAFGPRAVEILCEHHPTGYPEPELVLFLRRNGLPFTEVPAEAEPRTADRTSLTPSRLPLAIARVLLAMVVVPLRTSVGDAGR